MRFVSLTTGEEYPGEWPTAVQVLLPVKHDSAEVISAHRWVTIAQGDKDYEKALVSWMLHDGYIRSKNGAEGWKWRLS